MEVGCEGSGWSGRKGGGRGPNLDRNPNETTTLSPNRPPGTPIQHQLGHLIYHFKPNQFYQHLLSSSDVPPLMLRSRDELPFLGHFSTLELSWGLYHPSNHQPTVEHDEGPCRNQVKLGNRPLLCTHDRRMAAVAAGSCESNFELYDARFRVGAGSLYSTGSCIKAPRGWRTGEVGW